MKMQVCRCLPFFVALVLPGYGFLSQRSQESSASLTSSEVSTLKRRYWNDDLQPCIKKYCYKFQDTSLYRKCLQKYCPQGLIAIPRDLEAIAQGFSNQLTRSNDAPTMSLCAAIFCHQKSGVDLAMCYRDRCGLGGDYVRDVTSEHTSELLVKIGTAFTRVCKETLCQGLVGNTYEQCLISKCLSQVDSGVVTSNSHAPVARSTFEVYRKRRVNDDVSQCIQSYCGGKGFESRIVCIVKNCHNPSG